jgi:hyperosmotically inducible periplasmic protein
MTPRLTIFAVAALLLAGPAQALELNPFSAIKGAVEAAVEDRSASDIATDTKIKAAITADVIGKLGSDVISINSDVYEQDVMLTGAVKTQKIKDDAERLTKGIQGVKKIYNEILVVPAGTEQKGAVSNFVDDSVIEGKINAFLVEAKGINVTNFRWRAVGGKVFLFGRALSKAESDKAAQVVKGIDKVTGVVNRVKVKAK